ncbi:hypothetical protein Bca4012_056337 [Brassica carinata]|uniref:Uncharacterized protein n=1 Tax=Brassica carinata TaxID=52824 RepID=A0A8X7PEF6_BRACI|nr:hypothetical protein Bca52824_088850 [Brassica carinata]
MSGRSQHHNRYAIDDISEPCCCYTSRIKHHEPQHTPAARTRHAFELIEHSKALMARETEAAFRDTKEKTTAQALHAPHQSEPQGKSKSTIREPNRRAIKPPPRAITLARGLRDPPRSPKSRQHRIETSPSPRHDSTTHETTRALDPLSTEDRARSFPRSTDNNKAERVSETLVLQRRNREDKGKEGSSGVELDAHAPFNHRRDSRSENFGERDKVEREI